MTEPSTDLALRRPEASLARPATDIDSWTELARPTFWLAEQIANTEFVPKGLRGNPAATAAAMLHGREMGLGPMTSLSETHVIEGKPSTSAKALRAKVLQAGHELRIPVTTGAQCVMRGRRRGETEWTEIVWSIDMAKAAGLANKTNWRNYPRRMLQARATSELCELIFADVTLGLSVAEVMEDEGDLEGEAQGPSLPAPEGPKTAVSRARKTTTSRTQPTSPGRESESAAAPVPAAADIPLPAPQPAPSGPETSGPGPEAAEQTDEEWRAQNAAEAPENDQPAKVMRMPEPRITAAQSRMLHAILNKLNVTEDDRHPYLEVLLGHQLDGGTAKSITKTEATRLIDQLGRVQAAEDPAAALDELIAEAQRGDDQ